MIDLATLPARIDGIVRIHAQRTPRARALVDGARTWSYGELQHEVERRADWLRRLGVRAGDRVMLVSENCAAQVALGRLKELIIRSGFNVHPPEVEAALNSHPGVLQSAVVGRPAADGDEEVLAFVETREAVDAQALQDWLVPRLAPYKRPSRIVFMDALPAAPSGKILKHLLL